jgi:hypothetical protein
MAKFQAGDLVEFNGKRYVVDSFRGSGGGVISTSEVYASPATKSGKADKRRSLQRIPTAESNLVKASASGT